jgi:NtrC-family two-component system response regulator AlgB
MNPLVPSAPPLRVLLIDDDKNIRATLSMCLENLGCEVTSASTPEAALSSLRQQDFDLAFLDLRLGSASGLDLLPKLLGLAPELFIVVITAYATFDTAVEAVKRGAKDYIPKPFTPAQIEHVVRKLAERRELTSRIADLEQQLTQAAPELDLQTQSQAMRAVLDTALRAAASDTTVLLRGESGTGKGVLARMIHAGSKGAARRRMPASSCSS